MSRGTWQDMLSLLPGSHVRVVGDGNKVLQQALETSWKPFKMLTGSGVTAVACQLVTGINKRRAVGMCLSCAVLRLFNA